MLFLYFLFIFIFGTILGSFSSVLIERWKSGKGGILLGRSECPICKKQLGFYELFPIFSYLFQGGKCAGCKNPISLFYPVLEFSIGIIFTIVSYGLYKQGVFWNTLEFWVIILCSWITGIYIFYDIRYKEIPDQIMIPGIYLCVVFLIFGYYNDGFGVFFDIHTYPTYHTFAKDHISGAIFLYSFFYFQILIPGGIFLIKNKDFKNFGFLLLSYFILPLTALIDLFKKTDTEEELIDIPTWIGGGDLRIALFIGLTLGSTHGVIAFGIAYILGSIVGIILMILAYIKHTKSSKEIVFGPFLGIGWIFSIVFHSEILDIVNTIF